MNTHMAICVQDSELNFYNVLVTDTQINFGDNVYKISQVLSENNFLIDDSLQILVTPLEILFLDHFGAVLNTFQRIPAGPKKITYLVNRIQNGVFTQAELSIFLSAPLYKMAQGYTYRFCHAQNPMVQIEAKVKSITYTGDSIIFNGGKSDEIMFALDEYTHDVCYIKHKMCYEVIRTG